MLNNLKSMYPKFRLIKVIISSNKSKEEHLTQDTICEREENITHKTAKRSALSQQVTTGLQWTENAVWQRQIRNTSA